MEYRILAKSELKQNILLCLLKGERKLSELKVDLANSETTILHALKELESMKFTTKNRGVYSLTSLGMIEARITEEYFSATKTLEKFQDFWFSHDVRSFSLNSMIKLGMLSDCELIQTKSNELGKVHENFIKLIRNSRRIKGLSPIFHVDYFDLFKTVLINDGTVDLILTQEVFDKTLEKAYSTGDLELFNKYANSGHLKVFLAKNFKIALTVTESVFSMGLFYPSGQYDYNTDLISSDSQAIQWGEEVFQEYLQKSEKIDL